MLVNPRTGRIHTTFNQAVAVNLTVPFMLAKHALPVMIEHGGGSFVFVSTVVALRGPSTQAYAATKAGLTLEVEKIDALIHLGTHGTLEWLPGKALALSAQCWPEKVLGPLPVIYPFIVNNPGEAVQAKRRLSAVVIGHLTPPLRAAGLHGPREGPRPRFRRAAGEQFDLGAVG